MIKDIVVNLSVSAKEGHSAEDYAISTASALGAHVTGVAFIYDTTVPLVYPLMSYGETPPEVIDALKREKADLAKEAAERFTKAASVAGVLGKSLKLTTSFAGSIDRFGQIARRFDLAIVGQIEPGTNAYESNVAEGALFCSGRPMIIVPYLQNAPFKLDRVMVCWDGGPQAARAVADAMPLLERAARIDLVIVESGGGADLLSDEPRHQRAPGEVRSRQCRLAAQSLCLVYQDCRGPGRHCPSRWGFSFAGALAIGGTAGLAPSADHGIIIARDLHHP
jgi:hypothetical protein